MAVPDRLNTLAVIGNGIIGHGVAELFAGAGFAVRMIGRSTGSLNAALDRIRDSLGFLKDRGLHQRAKIDDIVRRIEIATDLTAAANSELVIEAVPEDMELKLSIFARLEEICTAPAVLASSSGHLASEFGARVHDKRRVIATHFWYPPQLLPLVEVCGSPETAPEVIAWTCDVLRAAGKEPVVIDREIAGFIGNRIQFAALREAWALWAAGIAGAEAIDAVVRNSIGRRLGVTGPIESADVGGLDTMFHFARFLQPDLDASPEPPAQIADLVGQGARGVPNGRGVYDWGRRDGAALIAARKEELVRWPKADRDRKAGQATR